MGRPSSAYGDTRMSGISSKISGHPTAWTHSVDTQDQGQQQHVNVHGSGEFHSRPLIRWTVGSYSRGRPTSAPPAYTHTSQWADSNTFRVSTTYMDAAAVLSTASTQQQGQLVAHMRKARPKSASVTAAAWKAYGSPKLRGQIRPASPPSAAHPKANSVALDALANRQPTVGMLGGGFNYPPAASHHQQRAGQTSTGGWSPSSPGGPLQAIPEFNGRMINDPPVPAVPQLLQPFQPRPVEMLMAAQAAVQAGADCDEYRYQPTPPTDPTAQRTWSNILARYESQTSKPSKASHHRARPRSATIITSTPVRYHHMPEPSISPKGTGAAVGGRPGSARPRFSSMTVGSIAQLGTSYVPPAVTGSSDPEMDRVLPSANDPRFTTVSRMGATAIQRLAVGLKLPMSAAVHTGSASRPVSAMPAAARQQRTSDDHLPPPQSLLAMQQAELQVLLEAHQNPTTPVDDEQSTHDPRPHDTDTSLTEPAVPVAEPASAPPDAPLPPIPPPMAAAWGATGRRSSSAIDERDVADLKAVGAHVPLLPYTLASRHSGSSSQGAGTGDIGRISRQSSGSHTQPTEDIAPQQTHTLETMGSIRSAKRSSSTNSHGRVAMPDPTSAPVQEPEPVGHRGSADLGQDVTPFVTQGDLLEEPPVPIPVDLTLGGDLDAGDEGGGHDAGGHQDGAVDADVGATAGNNDLVHATEEAVEEVDACPQGEEGDLQLERQYISSGSTSLVRPMTAAAGAGAQQQQQQQQQLPVVDDLYAIEEGNSDDDEPV